MPDLNRLFLGQTWLCHWQIYMINELKVDMVIVGSHGHTGVSDLIHGSVINRLRHQIQASLLIIPIGADE